MNHGMNLQEMLSEVVRQTHEKEDYLADTKETIRMVRMPDFEDGVALVLTERPRLSVVGDDGDVPLLQRFEITEHCHKQIAARLRIPLTYYRRLLDDYPDLVIENVNTIFEREPETRMIRTLDGKARAFLSDRYRRVDNAEVLEATLPVIKNDYPTEILSTNVNDERMRFKCLFTGPEHTFDVGDTPTGVTDTLRAGFEMGNSEVGAGSFYIRGFFYRDFCRNGCVFGMKDTVGMRQIHVGSKLDVPADFVLSDETRRKEDELLISAAKDTLTVLSSPDHLNKMARTLRAAKDTEKVKNPEAAVEAVCKKVGVTEEVRTNVLESFIRDQDYSKWGMANAITNVANKTDDYEKASELEEIGGKIIDMQLREWNSVAALEKVAA